jgi:SPP1 family predicted phage head-tail adaptor
VSLGQYTQRYEVTRAVTADDGSGGQTVSSWAVVTTIWARLRAVSSREQAQAGAVQAVGTYQLMTHYTSAITSAHRLVPKGWTGATLEIVGVRDPDGHRRDLWIDAVEAVD